MLKASETYRVTVVLNDGQAMVCTLLSKPDGLTLAAVAEAQGVSAELKEAATFARSLVIPILGADAVKTPITVAGTQIGAVHIETESAFVWQARKPRKPKPAETTEQAAPTAEQAPPDTEQATTPKRKRQRKKNTDTETAESATDPKTDQPVTLSSFSVTGR